MLEKSLGLMFFLKRPQNYDGGAMYVYLKVTVDGVPKDLSTKRSWEPAKWNSKGNRASGNKEDAKTLNEYLDVLQNKAYDARKHLIDRGKVVTSTAIVELLSGVNERKWMLLSLFDSHNKDLKKMIGKGVAKGTYTNFNTSYKHTQQFIKKYYKVDDMNIRSLDGSYLNNLGIDLCWKRVTLLAVNPGMKFTRCAVMPPAGLLLCSHHHKKQIAP